MRASFSDESVFLKKGSKSAGVARQYSGTAGRVENCQIGVFLTYASPKGHTFLDRELYLPKEWTDDRARCQEAAVPEEVTFATKPQLAQRMLQRAFEAGISLAFVTGDTVYGSSRDLRQWLEARRQPYVLAVAKDERLWRGSQQVRAEEMAASLPASEWRTLSAGEGAKGPRLYDWACLPLNSLQPGQWPRWLLVRRSLSDPTDLAYYIVFAPAHTTLSTMVRVAGTRWTVEICLESGKDEVGRDEYEGRSFPGWYRHITLAMLAPAFLSVLRVLSLEEDLKRGLSLLPGRQATGALKTFKQARGLLCA